MAQDTNSQSVPANGLLGLVELPHAERTPWRMRLLVWPGMPFRTLPFPYILHRWDVCDSRTGWWASFFFRRNADRYIAQVIKWDSDPDELAKSIEGGN